MRIQALTLCGGLITAFVGIPFNSASAQHHHGGGSHGHGSHGGGGHGHSGHGNGGHGHGGYGHGGHGYGGYGGHHHHGYGGFYGILGGYGYGYGGYGGYGGGYGGYGGYGYPNGGYYGYSQPNYYQQPGYYGADAYYSQQTAPILPPNTLPQYPVAGQEAPPIEITNPSPGTIRYRLNGTEYTMTPGQTQRFRADRQWTIEFDRGTGSAARYSLTGGNLYKFTTASQGWDLTRAEIATAMIAPPPPTVSGVLVSPVPAP